ncbi:MAG: hypothetical protein R3C60_09620 [Parvularculaceae bacterium]
MNRKSLARFIAALLIISGILHLIVAIVGAPDGLRAPLAIFGVIFGGIGFWTIKGGRPSIIAALVACLTGLALGGSTYVRDGGPITLPIMFAIDIFVVFFSILWLFRRNQTGN